MCSPFLSYLSRCFDRSFSFFSHLSFYSEFGLYASLLLVFFFMFIKNGSNSVRVKNCLMEEFHIKITSKLKSHSRRGERNVQMNKNESSQHTNTHDSNWALNNFVHESSNHSHTLNIKKKTQPNDKKWRKKRTKNNPYMKILSGYTGRFELDLCCVFFFFGCLSSLSYSRECCP